MVGTAVPFRAHLLVLRGGSARAPRRGAWLLARGTSRPSLSSMAPRRVRSRPLTPSSRFHDGYPKTHCLRRVLVLRASAVGCVAETQRAEGARRPGGRHER